MPHIVLKTYQAEDHTLYVLSLEVVTFFFRQVYYNGLYEWCWVVLISAIHAG